MRPRTNFGSKQPSAASQKADFLRLITNAPKLDALPGLSQLAHMYRVPIKEAEYLLTIERQRRATTAATPTI